MYKLELFMHLSFVNCFKYRKPLEKDPSTDLSQLYAFGTKSESIFKIQILRNGCNS